MKYPPVKILNWCSETNRVREARETDPTVGLVPCLEHDCPRFQPEYPYCILMQRSDGRRRLV
jgi:hypothetical protein